MRAKPGRRRLIAVALLAGAGLASPAAGQEYCVACTGPDATYRCSIEQAVPTGLPLKMLCVGTLAREGGHATCAVRGGTVFDCKGPIRRIDARAAGEALAQPPAAADAAPPAAAGPPGTLPSPAVAPAKTKPEPEGEPPRTVEEMARRMSKSSGDSLGKTGSKIADSTAKAWACLTSFFKSC